MASAATVARRVARLDAEKLLVESDRTRSERASTRVLLFVVGAVGLLLAAAGALAIVLLVQAEEIANKIGTPYPGKVLHMLDDVDDANIPGVTGMRVGMALRSAVAQRYFFGADQNLRQLPMVLWTAYNTNVDCLPLQDVLLGVTHDQRIALVKALYTTTLVPPPHADVKKIVCTAVSTWTDKEGGTVTYTKPDGLPGGFTAPSCGDVVTCSANAGSAAATAGVELAKTLIGGGTTAGFLAHGAAQLRPSVINKVGRAAAEQAGKGFTEIGAFSEVAAGVAGVASGLLALGSLGLAIYNGVTTYQQQQHAAAVCTSSQCAF